MGRAVLPLPHPPQEALGLRQGPGFTPLPDEAVCPPALGSRVPLAGQPRAQARGSDCSSAFPHLKCRSQRRAQENGVIY